MNGITNKNRPRKYLNIISSTSPSVPETEALPEVEPSLDSISCEESKKVELLKVVPNMPVCQSTTTVDQSPSSSIT